MLAITSVAAAEPQKAAAPGAAKSNELDRIQGNWKLVGQEAAVPGPWWSAPISFSGPGQALVWKKFEGPELRKDIGGKLWARVAGNRVCFTFVRDGKKTSIDGKLKLDPSTRPKALDLTFQEEKKPPETALFIYTLEGDKLTVAFEVELGKKMARPKAFDRRTDSHQVIVHFQRESR
jgi:uncharacterized protein (TIGR03067 family)